MFYKKAHRFKAALLIILIIFQSKFSSTFQLDGFNNAYAKLTVSPLIKILPYIRWVSENLR